MSMDDTAGADAGKAEKVTATGERTAEAILAAARRVRDLLTSPGQSVDHAALYGDDGLRA